MNKVVILLGPTGVGKTGVSLLLAKILHTEIINADSMQIYRHMDIGTAKPSPGERKDVKHHMINIADPWETYSTAKYIAAVSPIFENLHRQGEIPVVVHLDDDALDHVPYLRSSSALRSALVSSGSG